MTSGPRAPADRGGADGVPSAEVPLEEPAPPGPSASAAEPVRTTAAAPGESPWRSVWTTPFRGGSLAVTLGVLALAALAAWWQGGATAGEATMNALLRGVAALAAIALLALSSHRIVLCTIEDDRAVPWGRDERDETTWAQDIAAFAAVLVTSASPAVVLGAVADAAGAPGWLVHLAMFGGFVLGAAHLPFALAATVLRRTPFAAHWGASLRAWRADRGAARTAVLPSLAFLALAAAAVSVGAWLLPTPSDDYARPIQDHTGGRDAARALVFALHAGAACAAFASFRVAGLVVREVPGIRVVLS